MKEEKRNIKKWKKDTKKRLKEEKRRKIEEEKKIKEIKNLLKNKILKPNKKSYPTSHKNSPLVTLIMESTPTKKIYLKRLMNKFLLTKKNKMDKKKI